MINRPRFQLRKDGYPTKQCFCIHPELIENYDLAMTDGERTWICHHKKEEFYTVQELKDLGMYYNVPPEDLVFVRDEKMHQSWIHKGHACEETKKKMSESQRGKPSGRKGKHLSEETKKRISENYSRKVKVRCMETGQVFESMTAARKFTGLKATSSIQLALKNPNYTAGGYHWISII